MLLHTGIILLPQNHVRKKTALLDQSFGIIQGYVQKAYAAGSVIQYHVAPCVGGGYFINSPQLYYCPIAIAAVDIEFLHHILELCYFFAPIGSCVNGLFELFAALYSSIQSYKTSQAKKYFIFKVLVQLGLWPEAIVFHTEKMIAFAQKPIASVVLENIDPILEKELELWVKYCILQHPRSNLLRTMSFYGKKNTGCK